MTLDKIKRNPWPYGIIGYFIGFASLIVAWVVFAVGQDMDLVRKDYYEHEILFQGQLDRMNRAAALQGRVMIGFDPATREITLRLPPSHAAKAEGTVELYRPSSAKLDRSTALRLGEDGAQRLDANGLAAGLWRVRVEWTLLGEGYYFEQPLVIGGI